MPDELTQEAFEMQSRTLKLGILTNQAAKLSQEARMTAAVAYVNEINVARELRAEEANLSNDIYHQRFYFASEIDDKSVRNCIQQCTYWANSKPRCDIVIIFNSQGGSLFHGMMLFDFLKELDSRGHCIKIGTYGLAASMAGILLQAASKGHRYVGRESWTLIHEVQSQAQGSASGLKDAAKFAEAVSNRVRDIFLENAEAAGKNVISPESFAQKWERQEWWLDANQMIEYGFADKMGSPIFEPEV